MKTLYWISVPAQKVTWSFDQVRLNYATTHHHLQPPTSIHHHPPSAKIYRPPLTTTYPQPKYIHQHPPPPTNSQNISTTTNHSPNYIQVRCFIRMTTIRMTTKSGRVVAYNEELPFIKSHYLLIKWSSDFDFSHSICRFRTKTPKSSPTSCFTLLIGYDNTKFGNTNYQWVLERNISWSWLSMSTKSPHQMIQNS